MANADEYIRALPEQYNTIIGDRGVRLSGGQGQRLAIARTLVRQPQLLLIDEATSALDAAAEQTVQRAIDRVSRNRTVIVIPHRLSTVRNADKIVVIDGGRVVEQGGHEQLTALRGMYWGTHSIDERKADSAFESEMTEPAWRN